MERDLNMQRLLDYLEQAVDLAKQFKGGYSEHFSSAEDFYDALFKSVEKLKKGDKSQLEYLQAWFAPTYDWDDFIGKDGLKLSNAIYGMLGDML